MPTWLKSYLPILTWGKSYTRTAFTDDCVAAVIVTIMLIPQSLAYAMLAGLPPQVGLYASILPAIAYAIFGTSRSLAVGPVAVISLMTAAAIGNLELQSITDILLVAATLSILSGLILVILGVLKFGFIANFLSHPVISGFITASGIIIAASQLKYLFGVPAHGHNLVEILGSLWAHASEISIVALAIGIPALAFLFWVRKGLKPLLIYLGFKTRLADIIAKAGPVVAVILTTAVTALFGLNAVGLDIVGAIPQGMPPLTLPSADMQLWLALLGSASLISVIGFVESISVAQTLAAKKRERIDPDQELVGLGMSNIASGFSGGYPVTGSFSRSVVNYDAGSATPAAGAYVAIGIGIATVFLTPLLYFLPKATLAATIIVAVLSLVDFSMLRKTWEYSKPDFVAVAATIVLTLAVGVEVGVVSGVALSILLYLYRTSRPHMAIVGQVGDTMYFRNAKRHIVKTDPEIITLRVDGSLYFANARALETKVFDLVAKHPRIKHFILMCSSVNEIDASALESLEAINERLDEMNVKFHMSAIKDQVMDRLLLTHFFRDMTGKAFSTQYEAFTRLRAQTPDPDILKASKGAQIENKPKEAIIADQVGTQGKAA